MRLYSTQDLQRSLADVGITVGDSLLIHSALFSLGRYDGTPDRAPLDILAAIREVVGPTGTICVPAFSFSFCRGDVFDRQRTPSENMGVFSETVRMHHEAGRTRHPIHSLASIGRLRDHLCAPDPDDAFHVDGPFGILQGNDAKLVLLGASIQAAALIHFVENRVTVPYRYWKQFVGNYVDNDVVTERTYRYYVRDLAIDPCLDLHSLERELGRSARTTQVGAGRLTTVAFADFIATSTELLARDPWFFVSNRP